MHKCITIMIYFPENDKNMAKESILLQNLLFYTLE